MSTMDSSQSVCDQSDFEGTERAGWSTQSKFELINLVRDCPELWNEDCPEYKNRSLKQEALVRIGQRLNRTEHDCFRTWHTLRSQVAREINKRSATDGRKTKWKYLDSLDFVHDFIIARKANSQSKTQEKYQESEDKDGSGDMWNVESASYPYAVVDLLEEDDEVESKRDVKNDMSFMDSNSSATLSCSSPPHASTVCQSPSSSFQPPPQPHSDSQSYPSNRAPQRGVKRRNARDDLLREARMKRRNDTEDAPVPVTARDASSTVVVNGACERFGQYIAMSLSELPLRLRAQAQLKIQQVLYYMTSQLAEEKQ